MRKITILIAFVISTLITNAQISDIAIIPIGVTLNSIQRLTVTSGGNIEFVVNTMDQYYNGINATTATTTTFNVASSQKFNVKLFAENSNLIGTVDANNKMEVDAIEYKVLDKGTKPDGIDLDYNTVLTGLTNTPTTKIIGFTADQAAGSYTGIQIEWSLCTTGDKKTSKYLTTLAADRYVTNAYLRLEH